MSSVAVDQDLLAIRAAKRGDFDAFRSAMEGGVDPRATDRNGVPLIIIAAQEALPDNTGGAIVLSLIENYGVDKNTADLEGYSAIFHAARRGELGLFLQLRKLHASQECVVQYRGNQSATEKIIDDKGMLHPDINGPVKSFLEWEQRKDLSPNQVELLNFGIAKAKRYWPKTRGARQR